MGSERKKGKRKLKVEIYTCVCTHIHIYIYTGPGNLGILPTTCQQQQKETWRNCNLNL